VISQDVTGGVGTGAFNDAGTDNAPAASCAWLVRAGSDLVKSRAMPRSFVEISGGSPVAVCVEAAIHRFNELHTMRRRSASRSWAKRTKQRPEARRALSALLGAK